MVIDDDIPEHDKSSGSKRSFELLKIFKNLKLNIFFLPNNGLAIEPYYTELSNLRVKILLCNPNRKAMLKELNAVLPFINVK